MDAVIQEAYRQGSELREDGLENGAVQETHTHNFWELNYFLDGTGYLQIDDEFYAFSPGTIICVPPNTPHSVVSDDTFQSCHIGLHISMLSNTNVCVFYDEPQQTMRAFVMYYTRLLQDRSVNYVNILTALRLTMQHILLGWQGKQLNSEIVHLAKTMQQNIGNDKFDLTNTIRALPLNDDYIRRLFKEAYGVTPLVYLNQLRVSKAKACLIAEALSVKEIAHICGFSNAKYFSRVFHSVTGMAPQDYRKYFQEKRQRLKV